MSDVTFAIQTVQASVVGNIGAPLRTGGTGEMDADSEEEVYFSKNPFKFGLVEEEEGGSGDEEKDSEDDVRLDVVQRGLDEDDDGEDGVVDGVV